jgi:group II intron reverse transcriptase/maturase
MTIHSKDGYSWAERLARIGEISAHDKNLVFNNLGHLVNVEALRGCFERLDGTKALGVDRVSKEDYGKELATNLQNLIQRIRKGTYRPNPSRITKIPKDDGSMRPLAIACTEDKLVQKCVSEILTAVYEPVFLRCSFGFRAQKSCHDALRALNQATYRMSNGGVVEIDLRQYFNTIPHSELMDFLRKKICDERFLALVECLLKAPTVDHGVISSNELGCPQGSILSPVLSNIYLHYVIDEWFASITASHFGGGAEEIRYADDLVFVFKKYADAKRFFDVLPKRLQKFGLTLHECKSQLVRTGNRAAAELAAQGQKLPTYRFLGFTCYWALAKNGKFWRLKFRSRSDRTQAALRRIRKFLYSNINTSQLDHILRGFRSRVVGWLNYHAVTDNQRRVGGFLIEARRILLRWFRRRGSGRRAMTEKGVNDLLKKLGISWNFRITSLLPPPKSSSHGSVVR